MDTPLKWVVDEFLTARSKMIVIIVYLIAVVVVCLGLSQNEDPDSGCFVRMRKGKNKLWNSYVSTFRGDDYYTSSYKDNDEKERKRYEKVAKECTVTSWAVLHFILYFILGFLTPKYFWPLFVIGVGWEIYEAEWLRCHCFLDIVWNLAGLSLGWYLRNKLFPYPKSHPTPGFMM